MPTTSVNTSSSVVNGAGVRPWTDPTNAQGAPDFAYASLTNSGAPNTLIATDFDHLIGTSATITGITVRVRGISATVLPTSAVLSLTVGGFTIADTTTATQSYPTSEADLTFTWTDPLVTPTDINNSTFGVVFITSKGGLTVRTYLVDAFDMSITYEFPEPDPDPDRGPLPVNADMGFLYYYYY